MHGEMPVIIPPRNPININVYMPAIRRCRRLGWVESS
jgi:hypothetical protein